MKQCMKETTEKKATDTCAQKLTPDGTDFNTERKMQLKKERR